MRFDQYDLSAELKESLARLEFRKPTDIQYKAIPHVLAGEDVLAIAQTGTGKTAAFAIPVIDMLHRRKNSRRSEALRSVVMVPTRELAQQITDVFLQLARHTRVRIVSVFGGVDQDPQIATLARGADVLVATPGRLFDLQSQGHIDLSELEILILDEADHMLALGFLKDIRDLIRHLPRRRQTLFFSATIDENIKKLAYSLVNKPIRIQISPKDPVSKNVDHAVAYVEMDDKRFVLERFVNENQEKKILVFVRTRVRAERVASAMERVQIKTMTIHGDKDQKERFASMAAFKAGEIKVMIATDVSARGIDIPAVDFVINYDLPDVPENYVHRIGRTGRGTLRGKAYSFCSTEEKPLLAAIEAYITQPIGLVDLTQAEIRETREMTNQAESNWKKLLKEAEEMGLNWKEKTKGKKKK